MGKKLGFAKEFSHSEMHFLYAVNTTFSTTGLS
jgi:hypothetical protein